MKLMNLRKYLAFSAVFLGVIACSNDSVTPDKPKDPDEGGEETKTAIYPIPPSGWMGTTNPYNTTGWVGDIMPYYDNGKFHIFFLHDAATKPAGEGFHPIHKFESTNLVDFSYKGEMIPYASPKDPDFAIGTGSPIKVGDTYYFYYTGHNGIQEFVQNNPRESVLYATSKDLNHWTKNKEFKLTAPAGYYDYEFRDPHVFYNTEKNEYWMLLSTQTSSRKAVVLLFTSDDPTTDVWEPKGPLYTSTEEENYLMMECADVFQMGDYWYMFFSENWGIKGTHYLMANSSTGPWVKPENDMLDGEFFYAAKTASNGNNRYLFGWTARRMPENNGGNKEWAGNMVIHELTQAGDGTLGVKIPKNVDNLFKNKEEINVQHSTGSVSTNDNDYLLVGTSSFAQYLFSPIKGTRKIKTKIKFNSDSGNAGFVFKTGENESYKIAIEQDQAQIAGYNQVGTFSKLITKVPLKLNHSREYEIEIVIEGSVYVFYVNGQAVLSNRIYNGEDQEWGIVSDNVETKFSGLEVLKP